MILPALAASITAGANHVRFDQLGLHPEIFRVGAFALRWYSLAYIAGIVIGWWYLLKLIAQPGAPMGRRQADDLVFYATLGIILGGRIGYILFYGWGMFAHPLEMLKLWDGGMSFHGGVIGTSLAIILFARANRLNWLRIHDYVACCVPFGLFFGRCANFVNGELWGRPSDAPWAMVPPGGDVAVHPSQLYEAGLEGIALFALLAFAFWRTRARYEPGKLVGLFLLGYGGARFFVEFFRLPDSQFKGTVFAQWGFHMGQMLCLPMVLGGLWLILTAKRRRVRVVPIAGGADVA